MHTSTNVAASRAAWDLALFCVVMSVPSGTLAGSPSEVFEKSSPSIVVVEVRNTEDNRIIGSGVVIAQNEIVTNCHVVDRAQRITVHYQNVEIPAQVRYSDVRRDLCQLSVPNLKAPSAAIGTSAGIKVGSRVYAIGAPQGLELTLSEGIISSLRGDEKGRIIQTTAPISQGSSGGGLFDENARLLGLTTLYLAHGQNLNFAIPVEWIAELPTRHSSSANGNLPSVNWVFKAATIYDQKDWSELRRHAEEWVEAEPSDSLAWHTLGQAHAMLGRQTKGIEAYERSLRLNPRSAGVWNDLGVAYQEQGLTTKAVESYEQALAIDPDHADTWYNLGVMRAKSGQTAKATKSYQQAVRANPQHADAWNNLCWTYRRLNETTKAISACQQALRINPDHFEAWTNLGVVYAMRHQWDKAAESHRQALRINPKSAEAWYTLGTTYAVSGNKVKALEVHDHLRAIDPKRADEFFQKFVLP